MDLLLGNLADVKTAVLPSALATSTDFDAVLQQIGAGVAAALQRACNRQFARVENATFVTSAERSSLVVDRYPIESVSKIEIRDDPTTGWVEQTGLVWNLQEEAGLVFFNGIVGSSRSLVRVTFTGGWWYDTEEDYTGTLPEGATALPPDLKNAWLMQCQHEFERRAKMSEQTLARDKASATQDVELLPFVNTVVTQYRRLALI